jgi:hypothetical protein
MFDFILFVFFVLVFFGLCIEIIRLKNKNLELVLIIDQTIKDVELIQKKFIQVDQPEKEHLLSFLNETRDIAYKYIEDVHESLLIFKSEIENELVNPNEDSIKKIKLAFNKLKKIYPEDIPND